MPASSDRTSRLPRQEASRSRWHLAGALVFALAQVGWGSASGGTSTVFGPASYVRETGSPHPVKAAFSARFPSDACSITMRNGGVPGSTPVISAVVSLNGTQVAGPADFKRQAAVIERPVSVMADNELSVEIRGKPGSGFEVAILCPSPFTVPVVVGLSQVDAEDAIGMAGLSVGEIGQALRITEKTGYVVEQSPPAETVVAAGSPVDLTLVAEPPYGADEIIAESWSGTWTFTTTYRDLATGDVDSVVEMTDAICPSDPIALVLVEEAAGAFPEADQTACSGEVAEDRIEATCSTRLTLNGCVVDAITHITMAMKDESVVGAGSWSATNPCGLALPSEGQTFLISATRISPSDGGLCDVPRSSWLQKFVRNPLTVHFGVVP